jgi:N,N'-diacetyllegionaminate synthase
MTLMEDYKMSNYLEISSKRVGVDEPCFIIAEIAQAHDGSLGIAHSYIDAVVKAGADAIKFQTHIAAAESSLDEPFRVKFSYEDSTRYDYWKRMEFTEEQWKGLARHCENVGLIFLSSPFSNEAVDLLEKTNMPAWKVGSGEVNNPVILKTMVATGKPILLSSGMSNWAEIDKSVAELQSTGIPLALFQCTSKYPTQFVDVGLNVIDEMRNKYDVPIGLSDHSGSIFPALAAIANRVNLLEVHVIFDSDMFGPDAKASITLNQLKNLVEFRDSFYEMAQNPVDKNIMAEELSEMRSLFNKSIVLSRSIKKGSVLTGDMLTVRKPGTGLPAKRMDECIGKKTNKSLSKGHVLRLEDIGNHHE